MSESQKIWIIQANTFFIATFHPENGADSSHRGGDSGFIKVIDANKLLFPDYVGNNLFQTFGNLAINPNAGLLFINFAAGDTLQLTGKAEIIWHSEQLAEFADAQRLVTFEIEEIIETSFAFPWRWNE